MKQLKKVVSTMKEAGVRFWKEEDGIGVVEIILILVVLVGLVAVFSEQVTSVVNSALRSFRNDAKQIY